MKARRSTFLMIAATAIECGMIALGITITIVVLVSGFGDGSRSGSCATIARSDRIDQAR